VLALGKRIEARIRRDPIKPAAERAASVEAREGAPGPQERLLHEILGLVKRTQHPIAVHLELAAERFGELLERLGRLLHGGCWRWAIG